VTPAGPGQVLFAFVRHWSRRSSGAAADQGRLVLVTEAVHTLDRRGIAPTVNAIGQEIGIDQSGASRLVRNATEAGYLTAWAPDHDGRRRLVAVTPAGSALLESAHEWQEQVFDRLTEGWSAHRRRDFQQAMVDLMDRSYASAAATSSS
jgi:DNA-binding MarR family transcriptional regulator